jgi:PAS domain S-box-containing protein
LVADGLGGDLVVLATTSADGEWLERFGLHHPDLTAEAKLRRLTTERVRVGENRSSRVLLGEDPIVIPEMDPADYRAGAPARFRPFFEEWPVHATAALALPGPSGEPVGAPTVMRLRAGEPLGPDEYHWLEEIAPAIGAIAPAAAPASASGVPHALMPLAGRPLGLALAVALPLVLSAVLVLLGEPGGARIGAPYLAGVAVVAAVAGRREATVTATLSLLLYPPVALVGAPAHSVAGAVGLLAISAASVVLVVDRLERAARSLVELERRDADHRQQDTTERLVAAERQALADSRFRSLVEATTSVTWRSNPDGELIEPQPAWEAYTGQPWAEQAGSGWSAMIHPDDRDAVQAAWSRNRAGDNDVFETPLRLWSAAAGGYRHAMARAAPLRDRRGQIIEWIGAITDIHEQVQAHERADRAAALLDTPTRQAPVGFGFLDPDAHYHLVNDQLALIDGRPEADHSGQRPDDVSPATAVVAPIIRSVIDSGEGILDETVLIPAETADSTPRELQVSAYPVRSPDGGLLGVGLTVVEVTEQNRLERELTESRARLAALMEADVLAFVFGEDDRVTHANDAFLDLVGHRRADLDAGLLSWSSLTAPGWEDQDRVALVQLERDGRADAYEKEYLDADGHRVPVEVGVVAIDHRPLRWTAYVVDLRERKAVEQRLRDAYDQRDQVARTLQTSLLPPRLPQPDGIGFAARYLPSPVGEGVGGDFYDVYQTHAGAWHVVIGDVCGRGTDAAALTALSRYTLRAAAIDEEDPTEVLRVLNDAVRTTVEDGRFCTVSYTVLRPADRSKGPGHWHATVALGGHHPLRLLRAGTVRPIGRPGTLIGVFANAPSNAVEIDLRPGDIVVGFTDGLIEQARPPFDEAALDALLTRLARAGADLDAVMAAIEAHVAPEAVRDDDTAILAFEIHPAG